MRCPRLAEIPPPPNGKTGWPWTEASDFQADAPANGQPWPRLSVVTPSFNQGQFLEETIRSVLLQGYPNLEYLLLDGGSTDGSVEIIKKYSRWISYWVSEPDGGQSEAINRGLRRATGEFATWINSDDLLCRNALAKHAENAGFHPNTVYIGFCLYIDEQSRPVAVHQGQVRSLRDLVRIEKVWRAESYRGHIDQPAVLFPRELALLAGGLNRENHATMDYELWGALLMAGATFQYTDIQFGMFRQHGAQKTANMLAQTESLIRSAAELTRRVDEFSEQEKQEILGELESYLRKFRAAYWKGSGRLAKIGLPPVIVTPLRQVWSFIAKSSKASAP